MNRVSVKIDGVDYQIAGEKNEAEIVKVAKYIDGELKNISKAAPSLSKTSAAILTSVNIADKLFDRDREIEELKKVKEMENKVAVAENMAAEFQNKAYNLQLNYEELKNKTNK